MLVCTGGPDVAVLPRDALLRALTFERGVLGRGGLGRHGEVGDDAVALDQGRQRVARGLAFAAATVDPRLSEYTDRPIDLDALRDVRQAGCPE